MSSDVNQTQSHQTQERRAQYVQAMGLGPLWVQRVPQATAEVINQTTNQAINLSAQQAQLMVVVGEAPGAQADAQGLPLVGREGALLEAMLAALGLNRHSQAPKPHEVAACTPFLRQQLALVNPKVLLLMGPFAAQTLLQSQASVGELRGQVHTVDIAGRAVPAVLTHHPAYLLLNPADKAQAWDDLLTLKACLAANG